MMYAGYIITKEQSVYTGKEGIEVNPRPIKDN